MYKFTAVASTLPLNHMHCALASLSLFCSLLINTTKDLINTWQQQHKAAAQGASSDSPAKPHAGSEGSGGPAPASASFLSLLLEERRKANNEVDKLTDLQVCGAGGRSGSMIC